MIILAWRVERELKSRGIFWFVINYAAIKLLEPKIRKVSFTKPPSLLNRQLVREKKGGKIAAKILGKTSPENAFKFYIGPNQPLGVYSDSLSDLCDRKRSIDIKSIEYHLNRGDFESWIHYLGDIELEKRLGLIKKNSLKGEALRKKLNDEIKSRCEELRKISFE